MEANLGFGFRLRSTRPSMQTEHVSAVEMRLN
jgi:hypothetical protein